MSELAYPILQERYQIESLLGRYSGRRTFLAIDQQTQQSVVIKILLFGPDFTWDDLKLFQREAEVLETLNHPHIPRYLDSFEVELPEGKGFALVQSYIPAPSLQQWLDRGRTFSEPDLEAITIQLLEILADLHARQPAVVHRDIKPSNILLSEDRSAHSPGQIYLVDFGSVQTAIKEGTRTVVGTYGYMPPEQFGGITTPAADIYALGATLIHLASGTAPSDLPQKSLRPHFEDRVTLKPHYCQWLQKTLAPYHEERWPNALQALAALKMPSPILTSTPLPKAGWVTQKPHGSKVQITETISTASSVENSLLTVSLKGDWLMAISRGCIVLLFSPFVIFIIAALLTMILNGLGVERDNAMRISFSMAALGSIVIFIDQLIGYNRLEISARKIIFYRVWSGRLRVPFRTADRQHVQKISLSPISVSSTGRTVHRPEIIVWAGMTAFKLGGAVMPLSRPELEWIAYELSQRLTLPIQEEAISFK
jgi:serine/threonine protein kinase